MAALDLSQRQRQLRLRPRVGKHQLGAALPNRLGLELEEEAVGMLHRPPAGSSAAGTPTICKALEAACVRSSARCEEIIAARAMCG